MNESTHVLPDSISIEGNDFFDFGCSTGANITHTNSILPGLRGLGIDIDQAKIASARGNGHQAMVYDILKLPDRKLVDFVTMAHFLEHLPSLAIAEKMMAKAISVARDFVLVRQPWFDSDGDLLRRGLKFYWSHWHGHRNKMTSLDFHSMLTAEVTKGRISGFAIYGRAPVKNSKHPSVLPLEAPIDQHQYAEALHGPKPNCSLPFPAFKEIVVRVDIRDADRAGALMAKLEPMHALLPPANEQGGPGR